MGTTLTGKKIKDTYKSLIKVTDNSEAGSSGKQLSDGNGNDFGLYIDTDGTLGVGGAATYVLDIGSSTDALRLPKGTTVQQPTGAAGIIRYNTTTSKLELYDSDYRNIATESYVSTQISNVLDSAPAALDTLNEIAAALNDDPNFHTTITNLINGKQATITGAATTITSSDLTADRAVISNGSGKVAVSAVTSTELGYLDGVTSAIQTQINGKQATLTPSTGINIDGSNNISVNLNNIVATDDIQGDAITAPKLAEFADDLSAATAGHILVSDGTDFTNVAMGGDAQISSSGSVTIQPNAVEASMIEDNVQLDGNESVGIPSGTTAQRNGITTPAAGMFRFNTTDSEFEGYDGTEWGSIGGGGGVVNVERNAYTGDGTDLTFDTTSSIDNENNVQIYIDGVYQSKTTYSTSGSTVTFESGNAPANGSAIEIIHHKGDTGAVIAADAIDTDQIVDSAVETAKINDGATTYAKLADEFKTRDSNVTLASGSATKDIDFDSKAVYEVTLPTGNVAVTLNFDGADIGMTKVVLIKTQSSAYTGTITLSQTTGTGTFVRLSSDDIVKDASTTNYMQITCIDKSSNDRTFIYTVGTAQT